MKTFDPIEHIVELRAMINKAIKKAIAEENRELNERPKVIYAEDFIRKLRSGELDGVTIIDVREPSEYNADNLGGINIPLGDIESRTNEIPKHSMVIVHCKTGRRSELAIEILKNKFGFNNLYNLIGGINAIRGITNCGCVKKKVIEAMPKASF